MKITSLGITIGKTINMGNYNNMRIEAVAHASVEPDDDLGLVRSSLIEECKNGLAAAWATRKDNGNANSQT